MPVGLSIDPEVRKLIFQIGIMDDHYDPRQIKKTNEDFHILMVLF